MAGNFIHKQLINAGSRDAVSNMLIGAGVGAGANTALGAAQGDFGIVGNATSGAMLGALGGAAMRHAGAKYGSGLMAARAEGKEIGSGLQVGMMTKKVDDPAIDFWGKETDAGNLGGFHSGMGTKAARENAGPMRTQTGPKAGADTSGTTNGTPVTPQTPPPLPNPFPNQSVPKPTVPSQKAANDSSSAYTPTPGVRAPSMSERRATGPVQRPVQESSDGLDGARAAIKRADEWKASEKARIRGERQDKKRYDNWKKENATYGGENKRPMTGAEYQGYKDKQQAKVDARNAEVQKRALIKQQGIERQQENAALEAQARKEMYGY